MRKLLSAMMLGVCLILSACGGGEKPAAKAEAPASTEQTTTASDVATVTIEGNDAMQFNLKEIKVKAGQTVELTLKHVGKLPKATMGHNWVLLAQGTDVASFAADAVKMKANDYLPEDTSPILAHTKLLGGGESDTITFEAPAAGTYDFICTFPGHFAMMKGKFIVE